MFLNFSKNKYWTYLFLFIGFYVFINVDSFSWVWRMISGVLCVVLVFRWRSHALEYAADRLYWWELKEIIRKYDIPRKRTIKPVKKKKKSRSGLEPLLEALQAPVLPLNDLDKSNNPNQSDIDIIIDNKRLFDEQKKKDIYFRVELFPGFSRKHLGVIFHPFVREARKMFYMEILEVRKKCRIHSIKKKTKYPYICDKEILVEEFRCLGRLLRRYIFLPARSFVCYICWLILALMFFEFLLTDVPAPLVHSEFLDMLQEKFIALIILYFPSKFSIYVYKLLLACSLIQPVKKLCLFFVKILSLWLLLAKALYSLCNYFLTD